MFVIALAAKLDIDKFRRAAIARNFRNNPAGKRKFTFRFSTSISVAANSHPA
jgi:hypothetical protein